MKFRLLFKYLTVLLLLITLCNPGRTEQIVDVGQRVDELVSQLPVRTPAQQSWVVGDLLDLGPSGITHLLRRLGDTYQDDQQARLMISALAKYLGADPEHESVPMVEERFTAYLLNDKPPRAAQTFVLNQLQFFASELSVPPLGQLITDVCFPAIRVLTTIGTEQALAVMLRQSDQVPSDCHAAILQACAELKGDCQKLANTYRQHHSAPIREASFRALLVSDESALADNYRPGSNRQASHQLLDVWERAAAQDEVGPLKGGVGKILRDSEDTGVRVRALRLAAQYLGESSVGLASKALKQADDETAAQLIGVFHDFDHDLQPLLKSAEELDLSSRIALVRLAAAKSDEEILPVARRLLSAPSDAAKKAGLQALSSLRGKSALPELAEFAKQAKSAETAQLALSEMSRYIHTDNQAVLREVLHQANETGKAATVDLLARRKMTSYFPSVLSMADATNQELGHAVFRSLRELASSNDLAELLDLADLAGTKEKEQQLAAAIAAVYDGSEQHRSLLTESFTGSSTALAGKAMAQIGDDGLLDFVYQRMLETGGYENPARSTLLQWAKPNALAYLHELAASKDQEVHGQSLRAIVRLAIQLNPTQRLLRIRDVVALARTPAEKRAALMSLSRNYTVPTLRYLASQLKHEELQMAAAGAMMRIGQEAAPLRLTLAKQDLDALQAASEILGEDVNPYAAAELRSLLDAGATKSGYKTLFNGVDLSGWQGLVGNPISRAKMTLQERQEAQGVADSLMEATWFVQDGILRFDGDGYNNLVTAVESFDNFELVLDWKIEKGGDSGIYLRGSPQVQIWDTDLENAQMGSGGLFNNQIHPKEPLVHADNPVGEWNTFHITMINDRVTVMLNGELVVDNVVLENYWDRSIPIFARGPIELQAHTTPLYFRDIYVRPIEHVQPVDPQEAQDGFVTLFNGVNLEGWIGNKTDYVAENGEIVIYPTLSGGSGNLYTEKEYSDFTLRFEFQLTPGANNGLGIHTPLEGDAAYLGKELQILDNTAEIYANLKEYQYHGSAYGIAPAKRGFLKPVGEWNEQEVQVQGNKVKVVLNGETILDADLDELSSAGTLDGREHPGLERTQGHIGFLGHGSEVHFRNIRIKEM